MTDLDHHDTSYNHRELDRRIRVWETANAIACLLLLWGPMAAAAFHR